MMDVGATREGSLYIPFVKSRQGRNKVGRITY